jgi:hypothetical protein
MVKKMMVRLDKFDSPPSVKKVWVRKGDYMPIVQRNGAKIT